MQWVKDLASSLQWLELVLWVGFDPWPKNFHIWQAWQKNKKERCIHLMFVAVLIAIAKTWKQPKGPSTGEWIKMWYINTMEYYPAIKKNEIIPFEAR